MTMAVAAGTCHCVVCSTGCEVVSAVDQCALVCTEMPVTAGPGLHFTRSLMGWAGLVVKFGFGEGVHEGIELNLAGKTARRQTIDAMGLHGKASSEAASLASLLVRAAIADVVQALEGRNDLLLVRHHDVGGVHLHGHLVEDSHHRQGPLAVQRSGGLSGQDHREPVRQRPGGR